MEAHPQPFPKGREIKERKQHKAFIVPIYRDLGASVNKMIAVCFFKIILKQINPVRK